jgi:hypothetical protein
VGNEGAYSKGNRPIAALAGLHLTRAAAFAMEVGEGERDRSRRPLILNRGLEHTQKAASQFGNLATKSRF